MKVKTLKPTLAELRKIQRQLAADRDKLREWYDAAESTLESTNEGIEDLESAIEKLSEYV
jgi:hypothetical protein